MWLFSSTVSWTGPQSSKALSLAVNNTMSSLLPVPLRLSVVASLQGVVGGDHMSEGEGSIPRAGDHMSESEGSIPRAVFLHAICLLLNGPGVGSAPNGPHANKCTALAPGPATHPD